jgi:hypothetical protein
MKKFPFAKSSGADTFSLISISAAGSPPLGSGSITAAAHVKVVDRHRSRK